MGLRESFRSFTDRITGTGQLRRQLFETQQNLQLFIEASATAELQLADEDSGWTRIAQAYDTEFTYDRIQNITRVARVYRLANPLCKRAIEIQADYVFGKGLQIKSPNVQTQKALDDFLAANDSELGLQGLWEKECTLRTDGNVYIVAFTNESTGVVTVRTIDALEIADKICNPDDSTEAWYFKRTWNQSKIDPATGTITAEPMSAWYPAMGYQPDQKILGRDPVQADARVLHVKVGGLEKWKWGLSELYSVRPWAKAFTMFLESWATIQESLKRIAVIVSTPGGSKAQTRIKTQVGNSTLADGSARQETNPPPVTGAWWIGGPNQKVEPMLTKNATTAPDEARQLKLMVCAGVGTPEHMFGDPSTSNLATAKTLDRPTELKFKNRQNLWATTLKTLCEFAMSRSIMAPKGRLSEAKADPTAKTVVVTFPPILEHDIAEWVGAVVDAATLRGQSIAGTIDPRTLAKMLLNEIPGVENVDAIVDEMYPPAGYDPEEFAAQPSTGDQPQPDVTPATKRQEALRALKSVIEKLATAA